MSLYVLHSSGIHLGGGVGWGFGDTGTEHVKGNRNFIPALQLFELLGPEGFEMIERLLQRRADIVDSLLSALPDQRLGYLPGEFVS